MALGKLKEHLKKCNSRPPDDKVYYLESANSLEKKGQGNKDDKGELNILTMSQDEKIQLIMKLVKFHQGNGNGCKSSGYYCYDG